MGRLSAVASRWPRLAYGVLPLAVVGLILALGAPSLTPVHPQLSKQSVIDAALHGYDRKAFPRVEAKLMHRRDLQHANPEWGGDMPNELIWVVAVSGNYGLSPSFGCCSIPSDYPGHNTWALAIFVDGSGAARASEFGVSYHGDWPPFFDDLPDLAAGA
jgi:hypothetical protein